MALKHGFESTAADGADATKLRPSNWGSISTNYATTPTHIFSGGSHGDVLTRDTGAVDGVAWSAAGAGGAAAAGTLTGATLASNVVNSSLTSGGVSWTVGGALALGTTSTDGIILQNTTAATSGVPVQISPRLRLRGTAWDTAASQTLDWFIENLPATAATPTSILKFGHSRNGGAATFPMTLGSDGSLITLTGGGAFQPGANVFLRTGTGFFFRSGAGAAFTDGGADGKLNLLTSAFNIGAGFDVATDAVLKVRTRAQTGYATVDCLGLKASGVAGATFGPAAVTSITVVNGIVTAVS